LGESISLDMGFAGFFEGWAVGGTVEPELLWRVPLIA